jgi:hypothetical protein
MQKKQLILMAILFVAGIILGIAGSRLYSCKHREEKPMLINVLSKISSDSANRLFHLYSDTAHIYSTPFNGFSLESGQITALYKFISSNSNLKGIRVYMGPNNPKKIRIIAGISSKDQEDNNYIYRMEVNYSDPCPPICDRQSSITAPRSVPSK